MNDTPAGNTHADNIHDFSDFDYYVKRHDDFEKEPPKEATEKTPLPCSLEGLDLQRPPGFVGRVADWIDGQCRYPRRKLAVASAIVGVGNIAGLRHEDTRDGITANMMAFCVAASSSGKEAVMQAFTEMHVTAGMQAALHGGIKSEQEIMRNVIDQQASFYNIDEIGILMTKIRNAQKRGGSAAYLEGIFGAIMSIYSKANSRVILGGDTKRELIKQYAGALSRAEEDGDEEREDAARRKLNMVEGGLERPFFSLVGYTTPSTFDGIMDGETATQGLLGRAIVVNEKDINPHPRHGFKRAEMPMTMAMKLMNLHGGDGERGAVEWRDALVKISTTENADRLLTDVLKWLIDYADEMNEATGEASVAMVRRAYEQIAKISFILAIPHGERCTDHVRWAFAYVRDEMEDKIKLVFANDNAKTKPEEAMAARILGYLDPEKGTTIPVLDNRLSIDRSAIETILAKLEEKGLVFFIDTGMTRRGKKVVKWYPKSQK